MATRSRLKCLLLFLVIIGGFGCKTKDPCTWSTAKDLATSDLKKCNADPSYYLMRKFSLEFNSFRKGRDIPLLPDDFVGIVWTANSQVRWMNPKITKDSTDAEVYVRKDIVWKGDTLKYDRTIYCLNDSLQGWLAIEYYLDTLGTRKDYKLVRIYDNKYLKDSALTKSQSDSLLSIAFAKYEVSKK